MALVAPSLFAMIGRNVARQLSIAATAAAGVAALKGGEMSMLAASSGISKTITRTQMFLNADKHGSIGDDACFITRNGSSHTVGVADGVGGWRTYGIDPSRISATLMSNCSRHARDDSFRPSTGGGMKEMLQLSFTSLLEEKEPVYGSTTACIISLCTESRQMFTANIGDSGFMLFRDGKLIHQSTQQLHYFNTPFQLSNPPPGERTVISDPPSNASFEQIDVQRGDIVLLATDGLFDNMHPDMILHEISKIRNFDQQTMERAANQLADRARILSFDPEYVSPFCLAAKDHGYEFCGGKPDDITVILAAFV